MLSLLFSKNVWNRELSVMNVLTFLKAEQVSIYTGWSNPDSKYVSCSKLIREEGASIIMAEDIFLFKYKSSFQTTKPLIVHGAQDFSSI